MIAAAPIACPRRFVFSGLVGSALVALALCLSLSPLSAATLPGEAGQITRLTPPAPIPELTITDMNEQPTSLAAYKGKPLIVNLWATWCGPCIKEMPSLAKLAETLKSRGVTIVAISEDRGGKSVVEPFLAKNQISGLPILLDKTSSAMKLMQAKVLPTTVLIDAEGREVARVFGDREWDTQETQAEIADVFGLKASQ